MLELVSVHHERVMELLRAQFINMNFFRWARPHIGLRRGALIERRSRKPVENADQRKKGHLWMDTR